MLTRRHYRLTVAAVGVMALGSGGAATSQQKPGAMAHSAKEMSAMKQEPHHLLAAAHKDGLVTFAKALQSETAPDKTVNPEFARTAVAEMKRSFGQMQKHHQEHMKTMDEKMKEQMADRMKQMDTHLLAIQEHLAAAEKEAQTSAPDSKSLAKYVAEILKHCEATTKVHNGAMAHKMN